jgi:hypothetical protein
MQKGAKVAVLAFACIALVGGASSYAAQSGGGIQGPGLRVFMTHEPLEVCLLDKSQLMQGCATRPVPGCHVTDAETSWGQGDCLLYCTYTCG